MLDSPKSILVIQPNNLGDVLMTVPVLFGLKKKYPKADLTFFVEDGFEAGILNHSAIDHLFYFKRKKIKEKINSDSWQEGCIDLHNEIASLQTTSFDLCINFAQHQQISYVAALIKVKITYGQHFLNSGNHAINDPWSQYLYTIPFARQFNNLHATDTFRRIAGVEQIQTTNTLTITDEEKRDSHHYLSKKGIDCSTDKLVVFQPGAALPAKRWPPDHFISLGQKLVKQDWQILISGAPSENDLVEYVSQKIGKGAFASAGETSFRAALANLSLASLCITGDTALMHGAAALGIKTYALFGATSPVETGPYGKDHWIFFASCNQMPCFCDQCKTTLCMKSILPETLLYCINNNTVPADPKCHIFTTDIQDNGDYRLVPQTNDSLLYFNNLGAQIVRRAFGEETTLPEESMDEIALYNHQSLEFLDYLEKMIEQLSRFLTDKDSDAIVLFEKFKSDSERTTGITQFWSALLNIRLNSVPLLDPFKGVQLSKQVCIDTKKAIERTIISESAL